MRSTADMVGCNSNLFAAYVQERCPSVVSTSLHDTFHVSNLKSATDVTFSKLPRKQISLPAEDSDEEEYEVERILDHRWDNKNKTFEYLIQWKGW